MDRFHFEYSIGWAMLEEPQTGDFNLNLLFNVCKSLTTIAGSDSNLIENVACALMHCRYHRQMVVNDVKHSLVYNF